MNHSEKLSRFLRQAICLYFVPFVETRNNYNNAKTDVSDPIEYHSDITINDGDDGRLQKIAPNTADQQQRGSRRQCQSASQSQFMPLYAKK